MIFLMFFNYFIISALSEPNKNPGPVVNDKNDDDSFDDNQENCVETYTYTVIGNKMYYTYTCIPQKLTFTKIFEKIMYGNMVFAVIMFILYIFMPDIFRRRERPRGDPAVAGLDFPQNNNNNNNNNNIERMLLNIPAIDSININRLPRHSRRHRRSRNSSNSENSSDEMELEDILRNHNFTNNNNISNNDRTQPLINDTHNYYFSQRDQELHKQEKTEKSKKTENTVELPPYQPYEDVNIEISPYNDEQYQVITSTETNNNNSTEKNPYDQSDDENKNPYE